MHKLLALSLLAAAPFAQQWAEAVAMHPDLREFQPMELRPDLLEQLRSWVPEGKVATFYDSDCKPVKLKRGERGLDGTANERIITGKTTKRIEGDEIEYATEVSNLGGGSTEYRRGADGGWSEFAGQAVGDLDVASGELASVDDDVARWTGIRVSLRAVCDQPSEHTERCKGVDRVCSACATIGFRATSHNAAVGYGNVPARVVRTFSDHDCTPCPKDPTAQELEHMRALLARREFFVVDALPDGPALFRTRAACLKASKQRRDAK